MRKLLLLAALALANCAGPPPGPADQAAAREKMCGPEAQTSRWHNCSALFITERADLLGASAAQLLAGYHGSVAVALLAMEQQRMSQADGRDVIERLTLAMQRDLPAAKAKDRPSLASRTPVCLPLAGGGDYCTGK
jgi:hypothetical protein